MASRALKTVWPIVYIERYLFCCIAQRWSRRHLNCWMRTWLRHTTAIYRRLDSVLKIPIMLLQYCHTHIIVFYSCTGLNYRYCIITVRYCMYLEIGQNDISIVHWDLRFSLKGSFSVNHINWPDHIYIQQDLWFFAVMRMDRLFLWSKSSILISIWEYLVQVNNCGIIINRRDLWYYYFIISKLMDCGGSGE